MSGQRQILLVEDDEMLRELFFDILEDEEYQVVEAIDGEDALQKLAENNYQLLISDIFMPKRNGIDLAIECQKGFPTTKIILMSGGGKGIEAQHQQQRVTYNQQSLLVDVFLKKPCSTIDFLNAVKNML